MKCIIKCIVQNKNNIDLDNCLFYYLNLKIYFKNYYKFDINKIIV